VDQIRVVAVVVVAVAVAATTKNRFEEATS